MDEATPKLLLVDDDRGLVDVLSMSLQDAGFEVAAAHGGEVALLEESVLGGAGFRVTFPASASPHRPPRAVSRP